MIDPESGNGHMAVEVMQRIVDSDVEPGCDRYWD